MRDRLIKYTFVSLILAAIFTGCSSGGDSSISTTVNQEVADVENESDYSQKIENSTSENTENTDSDSSSTNSEEGVEKILSYKLKSQDGLYKFLGIYTYYDLSDFDLNEIKTKSDLNDHWGNFTLQLSQEKELSTDITSLENIDRSYDTIEEIDINKLLSSLQDDLEGSDGLLVMFTIGSLGLSESGDENSMDENTSSDASDTYLKVTGQTNSYDENGTEDASIKDDGFYQAGIERAYNRNSNVVIDEVTGYIWEDADVSKEYSHEEALEYCESLSIDNLVGWSLPTVHELHTLTVYNKVAPAVDDIFNNFSSGEYWTKDIRQDEEGLAFIIDFYEGRVASNIDKARNYVRCVKIK